MKSKTQQKKETDPISENGQDKKTLPVTGEHADPETGEAGDDDMTNEEVKGLEEALKSADRGEPVTLQEFKKMAKKWGSK